MQCVQNLCEVLSVRKHLGHFIIPLLLSIAAFYFMCYEVEILARGAVQLCDFAVFNADGRGWVVGAVHCSETGLGPLGNEAVAVYGAVV